MISDTILPHLENFSKININFGKNTDIYFNNCINNDNFAKLLETYTNHYNYKIIKKIVYYLNNKQLVLEKNKKYLNINKILTNEIISSDGYLDMQLTKIEETTLPFSNFSCTKDYHNIESIELVKIDLNNYCQLHFIKKLDINNIRIVIQNKGKNNKLNINETVTFISNLIETIQKQIY